MVFENRGYQVCIARGIVVLSGHYAVPERVQHDFKRIFAAVYGSPRSVLGVKHGNIGLHGSPRIGQKLRGRQKCHLARV